MNKTASYLLTIAVISTVTLALPACDGGAKISGSLPLTDGAPMVENDFSFPAVYDDNGSVSIIPPEGPLPEFQARRTLSEGSGSTIEFGDPVVIDYKMYSWTTGELVESSDEQDEAVTLRAGVTGGAPEYLSKSLLGRKLGATMQIVFSSAMEDLPSYLDKEDAYIIIVELI